MKFYTQTHQYYCGIDLHARCLYVCILDQSGDPLVHKNIKATPQALIKLIAPYQDDLVIGVECMFSWYWVADLCRERGIAFILGHATISGRKQPPHPFQRPVMGQPPPGMNSGRLLPANPAKNAEARTKQPNRCGNGYDGATKRTGNISRRTSRSQVDSG